MGQSLAPTTARFASVADALARTNDASIRKIVQIYQQKREEVSEMAINEKVYRRNNITDLFECFSVTVSILRKDAKTGGFLVFKHYYEIRIENEFEADDEILRLVQVTYPSITAFESLGIFPPVPAQRRRRLESLTINEVEMIFRKSFPMCEEYWSRHNLSGKALYNIAKAEIGSRGGVTGFHEHGFQVVELLEEGTIQDLLALLKEYCRTGVDLNSFS